MAEEILDVKISQKSGTFWVQCPKCAKEHFGNALDGFLKSGISMRCSDNEKGCKTLLRLHK